VCAQVRACASELLIERQERLKLVRAYPPKAVSVPRSLPLVRIFE